MVNLLRRLTPPVVIALSPLLIIPVGLAAEVKADPLQDYAYLSTLEQFNVEYSDRAGVIELGHSICASLDLGLTSAEVVTVGVDSGWSMVDASYLVGAAIGSYCDWHMNPVGALR